MLTTVAPPDICDESAPDFNVRKEYEQELDYYYEQHPEDKGYVNPESLSSKLGGLAKKVIDARDHLYGYDGKGGVAGLGLHLKPVNEMNFLPGGMGGGVPDRAPANSRSKSTRHTHDDGDYDGHDMINPMGGFGGIPADPFGLGDVKMPGESKPKPKKKKQTLYKKVRR